MAKILVIDDDPDMLNLICRALQKEHQIDVALNSTFKKAAQCNQYDLILLDVMMPEEDGFSFCSRIRKEVQCPIIFLTAKVEDSDIVKGLGIGGDDYIKKPFSIAELRARVIAHLRRDMRRSLPNLKSNGLRFDMQGKEVYVHDKLLMLTKGEYKICEYLTLHAGQVFTKEQLYDCVFGLNAEGDPASIAEHIKNIRFKMKEFELNPIETVWGVGYKWKKENTQ